MNKTKRKFSVETFFYYKFKDSTLNILPTMHCFISSWHCHYASSSKIVLVLELPWQINILSPNLSIMHKCINYGYDCYIPASPMFWVGADAGVDDVVVFVPVNDVVTGVVSGVIVVIIEPPSQKK